MINFYKKLFSIFISIALLFSLLPVFCVFAASYSGSCGTNVTWTLDTNTGILEIAGTGSMLNWSNSSRAPWYSYRSTVKTVNIGDGVTSIGDQAFAYCSNLTSTTIGSSVKSVGSSAFSNCTAIKNINLPNGITTISDNAFYKCSSLVKITIPNTVTSIGKYAFYMCANLTDIYYEGSESDWTQIQIGTGSSSVINSATFHYNTQFIDTNPTSGKCGDNLTWVLDTSTGILNIAGSGSMYNWTYSSTSPWYYYRSKIKIVKIENTVTRVGNYAFYLCSNISDVYYNGTQEQWNTVYVGSSNDYFLKATFHFVDPDLIESDHNYPNSSDKSWTIEKAGAAQIAITFSSDTYTEKNYDFIYIYDRDNNLIGKYSGNSLANQTIAVKSDLVRVRLTSDSTTNGYGFRVTAVDVYYKTEIILSVPENSSTIIDNDNKIITGLTQNLSSQKFLSESISVSSNGLLEFDNQIIGTGTKLKVFDKETGDKDCEYTIIIFGDVNGDGWYDGEDAVIVSCLANGMLTKDDVGEAAYMAADCNHDGVIDPMDVALLHQAGLLFANIDQTKSETELATDSNYIEYSELIDQTLDNSDNTVCDLSSLFAFILEFVKMLLSMIFATT